MSVPILKPPGQDEDQGPAIRLLYCMTCNSIEEIPDYDGPPDYDHLLNISVERHRFPSGTEHLGALLRVHIKDWISEEKRREIIEKMKGGGLAKGLGAIDESFYDTRSIFYEDAMKCYNAHLRPKGQCLDYMSDSKILLPNTNADRKELGLLPTSKVGGPKVKLCAFCPVHVYNVTKAREQQGN